MLNLEKTVFADIIKLRDLKWVDYPELSTGAPNALTNVLIKERKREIPHT